MGMRPFSRRLAALQDHCSTAEISARGCWANWYKLFPY